MATKHTISRRQFVAGVSGLLLAGAAAQTTGQTASPASSSRLALEGGDKAVRQPVAELVRWGEPERQRLEAMLRQDSLLYWKGPQTTLFIERFQQFCPLKDVMTCSSGTAAIHIAVAACGIAPGDEVITSSVTDIGTVIGILYQQGVPIFAELGASTYNLDPADVERKITPKTKAIIAVHLAGNPCDMTALKAIADRHKLVLIEDCCQAWGAKYHGQPIGTIGHFACFSLQDSKHVTCGDGGVVASSDEKFGPLVRPFGDKGYDRALGKRLGFSTNYRMSEPQAAVAAAQLERLEHIASQRAKLGNLLTEKIQATAGIVPHQVDPQDRAVYWFYMFRLKPEAFRAKRAQFVKALIAEGVQATAGYIRTPLYGEEIFQQHAFFAGRWPIREFGLTDMDYTKCHCPETEAILETGVRVMIHEGMTEEYILDTAKAIEKVAHHYAA